MVAIPFFYFIFLFAYFRMRQNTWNMDLAATSILIIISFCAILIDINDVYGEYGLNDDYISLPLLILFCVQWTLVLIPIHIISKIPLQQHLQIKEKSLYVFLFIMTLSSILMVANSLSDIRDALVMDMADVRMEHYSDINTGGSGSSNYWLLPAGILVSTPFPTLALFFWFYMTTFMNCPIFLRAGILIASIVQAVLAIVMAGRAAMIYWAFDFFLMFSYYYQYLSKETKRRILIPAFMFGGLGALLFISITIARFDVATGNRSPLESLYAYAGQHIDNFCTMFANGNHVSTFPERIFPLFTKITTGNSFELMPHYDNISVNVSGNILVNVFDTFGAEIYLDFGWFGYIFFFILLITGTICMKLKWSVMQFHNIFILVIVVSFFTRGLFAWPFVTHYTTLALFLTIFCRYFFKYVFKI